MADQVYDAGLDRGFGEPLSDLEASLIAPERCWPAAKSPEDESLQLM